MLSSDEIDFVAGLLGLFFIFLAGIFFAGNQKTRSTWVTLIGGCVVTLIELYSAYRSTVENRASSDETRDS